MVVAWWKIIGISPERNCYVITIFPNYFKFMYNLFFYVRHQKHLFIYFSLSINKSVYKNVPKKLLVLLTSVSLEMRFFWNPENRSRWLRSEFFQFWLYQKIPIGIVISKSRGRAQELKIPKILNWDFTWDEIPRQKATSDDWKSDPHV